MRQAPTQDNLASRLRAAIAAQSTTAAKVARLCGFSKQNMQRFLSGAITRSKHLPTIAKELNVSLTWLTVGDPSTAPGWWHSGSVSSRSLLDGDRTAKSPDLKTAPSTSIPWQPGWQAVTMEGIKGRPIADEGDILIIDPAQTPTRDCLLLLRDARGMRLMRYGGAVAHHALLASVDRGLDQEAVRISRLTASSVVVCVMFAHKVRR
jgi:hypothetical protein